MLSNNQMGTILALWTHPRSCSTAFARMVSERNDFAVDLEPFGISYFFSDERRSELCSFVEPKPEYRFDAILLRLKQKASNQAVFIKDMAFYLTNRTDEEFLSCFRHTFLVRHPAKSLPSLFAQDPNFALHEAGYAELYHLFELVQTVSHKTPVVIDADDLVEHPEATVKAYCEACGIPYLPQALSWQDGLPPEFVPTVSVQDIATVQDIGYQLHSNLKKSTGLGKQSNSSYPSIENNEYLKRVYEYSLPYYQKLYKHRLRIPLEVSESTS